MRKWDLYLHQRIPLATHVKEMVVVDENRIEGSIDYCRALLVSGDTGNFVLSFAQAVTSQETNKGNEHTNFHLIYDNDDSNGHDDRESFSVPVKDSLNTIPQFAAVPFLRDPANLNDKSDTERGTLKADSRRLAKRVALSSIDSVPLESLSLSSRNTIEESLPTAIAEYRWGVWPLVTPASSTPRSTTLVQLPHTACSSSSTDDTSSQQRMSSLPLSVLSALRLGWLEVRNQPSGGLAQGGEAYLDLKIGSALPSSQYHVQRSVTVPGTIKDVVSVGDHVLVHWSDIEPRGHGERGGSLTASFSSTMGDDISREGLCLLDNHTLCTRWLHSSDVVNVSTGRVEMCLEGLPPQVWSQTRLYVHSTLPTMSTVTLVHRRYSDKKQKAPCARLSVYGVAPEATSSSKPSLDRMLVAIGGLSIRGEHLLYSVVKRQDQESKLLVTASEDAVQVIGWQRSNPAPSGGDCREVDPVQALAAATSQQLSLDSLGHFTHSWGNPLALETMYGGPDAFSVVISRALVGLEILSVKIDSTSPGRVTVHVEPERSIHFAKCFPMITSIKASRVFARAKPPRNYQGEEKEGKEEKRKF